jgi:hypothetical protein
MDNGDDVGGVDKPTGDVAATVGARGDSGISFGEEDTFSAGFGWAEALFCNKCGGSVVGVLPWIAAYAFWSAVAKSLTLANRCTESLARAL